MTNIGSKKDQAISAGGVSRRQALLSMAALAASCYSMKGWTQSATNWPLWTIEGKNGTVYLTGETPARATSWKDDRIETLVAGCSALWTETNQLEHKDPQALIKRYGIDGAAPLLSKLTEADQQRVTKVAEMAQMPLDSLAPFRPWLAAMALEETYYGAMKLPESGTAEKVLAPKAKSAGLTLSSEFATVDNVFSFMGEMSPLEEIQYLQYTLDHILDGTAENERIYSLWSRGDMSGAEYVVERMRKNQPDMYKKHVIGRNKNWVPRIDAMLNGSKPALIVVGFYHVAGPDGVLVQLKKHGLTVRAV